MKKIIPRKLLLNPGPVTTTSSVKEAMLVPDICHRENEFTQVIRSIQSGLKRIVHANEDYASVIFSDSGTGVLESVIGSLVPAGKKIAIITNGSYGDRLIEIAQAIGVDSIAISCAFDQRPSRDVVEQILKRDKDIVAIAMVHHETSTGMLNPLREFGELAHQSQRIFIVDAISSMGGIEIDMQQDNIDFLVSTANKCLQGLPGASFVIAAKDKIALCKNQARSFYLDLHAQYAFLESEGQLRFTPPVQVFYALQQAITEIFAEGLDQRILRYQDNFDTLIEGLLRLEFELMIPREYQAQLLAFVKYPMTKKVIHYQRLHDYLYARNYTIYPTKFPIENAMRFSIIGDLTADDIKAFLLQLEEALSIE